jgi:mono/diheme cytochrome c family protein
MTHLSRFSGRLVGCSFMVLVLAPVFLSVVLAGGCKARTFETASVLNQTGHQEAFIHWRPGAPGQNATWTDESKARLERLRVLEDPTVSGSGPKGLLDGELQRAAWGFEWQRDHPVGFAGIPLIVFRAILHDTVQPDSIFKDIWGDLTWYGLTPHPSDFDSQGRLTSPKRYRRPLPLGMGWTRSPATDPEKMGGLGQALSKAGLAPDFERHLAQRAFITCASCHTGRVAHPDGRIGFMFGAPSTEYDQTAFGKAVADTLDAIAAEGRKPGGMAALARRLNASIDVLSDPKHSSGEDLFPYGNDTPGQPRLKPLHGAVNQVLGPVAIKTFKERMPDILGAMVGQLALRNSIVGQLDAAAYRKTAARHSGDGIASQKAPAFNGDSPGQLDAFGFGGAIVQVVKDLRAQGVNVKKASEFRPWDYLSFVNFGEKAPVWNSGPRSAEFQKLVDGYFKALDDHKYNPADPESEPIVPRFAAKVDPTSIWGERPTLRSQANWDGNQRSAGARALSTSLAIVASPANVDVHGSELVASFMAYDPMAHGTPKGEKTPPRYPSASPVYPFAIKEELLPAGMKIFEAKCYTCHQPRNSRVYPIDPQLVPDRLARMANTQMPPEGWIGTDPYRAIQITTPVRKGLLALWNLTCQMRPWCASKEGDDSDVFRSRGEPGQLTGYVASPLDGIWARAPYLHNGSVPNVRALLVPRLRQSEASCGDERLPGFWRGNIQYNELDLGFVSDRPPFEKCNPRWQDNGLPSPFDRISGQKARYPTASKSARIYNTSLEGNSNLGHTGAYLWGGVPGTEPKWESWTISEILGEEAPTGMGSFLAADALIEYLKTL